MRQATTSPPGLLSLQRSPTGTAVSHLDHSSRLIISRSIAFPFIRSQCSNPTELAIATERAICSNYLDTFMCGRTELVSRLSFSSAILSCGLSVCLFVFSNYLIRIKLFCKRRTGLHGTDVMAICAQCTSIARPSLLPWQIVLLLARQSAMFAQLLSCAYSLCLIASIKIGYFVRGCRRDVHGQ